MNMVNGVYLAGGVRTAIGGFCGAFESVPAPALGSSVVKAAPTTAPAVARATFVLPPDPAVTLWETVFEVAAL